MFQTPPTAEEVGHCAMVRQDEVGDKNVIIFEHATEGGSKICTLALRAATENIMDDLERAVDDGVNNFKVLTRVSVSNIYTLCYHYSRVWPLPSVWKAKLRNIISYSCITGWFMSALKLIFTIIMSEFSVFELR